MILRKGKVFSISSESGGYYSTHSTVRNTEQSGMGGTSGEGTGGGDLGGRGLGEGTSGEGTGGGD